MAISKLTGGEGSAPISGAATGEDAPNQVLPFVVPGAQSVDGTNPGAGTDVETVVIQATPGAQRVDGSNPDVVNPGSLLTPGAGTDGVNEVTPGAQGIVGTNPDVVNPGSLLTPGAGTDGVNEVTPGAQGILGTNPGAGTDGVNEVTPGAQTVDGTDQEVVKAGSVLTPGDGETMLNQVTPGAQSVDGTKPGFPVGVVPLGNGLTYPRAIPEDSPPEPGFSVPSQHGLFRVTLTDHGTLFYQRPSDVFVSRIEAYAHVGWGFKKVLLPDIEICSAVHFPKGGYVIVRPGSMVCLVEPPESLFGWNAVSGCSITVPVGGIVNFCGDSNENLWKNLMRKLDAGSLPTPGAGTDVETVLVNEVTSGVQGVDGTNPGLPVGIVPGSEVGYRLTGYPSPVLPQLAPGFFVPSEHGLFRVNLTNHGTVVSQSPRDVFVTRGETCTLVGGPTFRVLDVTSSGPVLFPEGGFVTVRHGGMVSVEESSESIIEWPAVFGCKVTVPVGGSVRFGRHFSNMMYWKTLIKDDEWRLNADVVNPGSLLTPGAGTDGVNEVTPSAQTVDGTDQEVVKAGSVLTPGDGETMVNQVTPGAQSVDGTKPGLPVGVVPLGNGLTFPLAIPEDSPPEPGFSVPSQHGLFRVTLTDHGTLFYQRPSDVFVSRIDAYARVGWEFKMVLRPAIEICSAVHFPKGGYVIVLPGSMVCVVEPPESLFGWNAVSGCSITVPVGGIVNFCGDSNENLWKNLMRRLDAGSLPTPGAGTDVETLLVNEVTPGAQGVDGTNPGLPVGIVPGSEVGYAWTGCPSPGYPSPVLPQLAPGFFVPSEHGLFRVNLTNHGTVVSQSPRDVFVTRGETCTLVGGPTFRGLDVTSSGPVLFPEGGFVTVRHGGMVSVEESSESIIGWPAVFGCKVTVPVGGSVRFGRHFSNMMYWKTLIKDDEWRLNADVVNPGSVLAPGAVTDMETVVIQATPGAQRVDGSNPDVVNPGSLLTPGAGTDGVNEVTPGAQGIVGTNPDDSDVVNPGSLLTPGAGTDGVNEVTPGVQGIFGTNPSAGTDGVNEVTPGAQTVDGTDQGDGTDGETMVNEVPPGAQGVDGNNPDFDFTPGGGTDE